MNKFEVINNNLVIVAFIAFCFLWGLNAGNYFEFDIRLLIFLPLPLILARVYEDLNKKEYVIFKILSLFLLLIIVHYVSAADQQIKDFPKFILFVIAAGYLFCFAYYYHLFILNNKIKIIFLFYIVFTMSLILSIFVGLPISEPFSCGALKNFSVTKQLTFAIKEFLFFENSHFGMISVSLLLTSIFYLIKKKLFVAFKIFFFIFVIICFLKTSSTLMAGVIFSSVAFLLMERKRMNKIFFYVVILINLFLLTIFLSDDICKAKLVPKYNNDYYIKNDKVNQNISNILNVHQGSLSSAVFFHAANVTYHSFKHKPLGWGFQNYQFAFIHYNKEFPPKNKLLLSLNEKDGSNNFFKLIVEFGIFGFLIYLFIAYSFWSKNISLENKLFLFPFIITQSIRGAGYFNGGFILILIIIVMLQFNLNKKNNKQETMNLHVNQS